MMHIREGETSNEISSDKTSVGIALEYENKKNEKTFEANFSENGANSFLENINIDNKTISVEYEQFVPNAIETIVPDEQGESALSLFVMNDKNQGMDFVLQNGEANKFDELSFSFGDTTNNADINFNLVDNQLFFKSSVPLAQMGMMDKKEVILQPGISYPTISKTIYKANNVIFVMKTFMTKAKKNLTQITPEMKNSGVILKGKNAIVFKITDGSIYKDINVICTENGISQPVSSKIGDLKIYLSYGMMSKKLPFSITLRDFQLERYAGSNSPSSYASEITVNDMENNTERPFRIYMNNILNYRGYRFFQSSYDQDENGTVLSVNNDYWGTMITYIGYFLMMLGMILTLFNKESRFRTVLKLSNELQKNRKMNKTILLIGIIFSTISLFANENNESKENHIKSLNSLMIQDEAQGRIEPFNTFASDVIRKITKKTTFNDMSSVEILLEMSINPSKWQNEQIIKVGNAQLAKEVGAINDYISFNQLFDYDNGGVYRLKDLVEKTYQKEQATHNKYDKEIVNLDERVNICYQIFSNNMLAIFPIPGQSTGKWITAKPSEPNAENANFCPAGKMSNMENSSLQSGMSGMTPPPGMGGMTEEQINAIMSKTNTPQNNKIITNNSPEVLLANYFKNANEAMSSGNWIEADKSLYRIKSYQLMNGGNNLPSKNKIDLEIIYNNINIFGKLSIIYSIIGFVLLLLYLMEIFQVKSGFEKQLNFAIYPFIIAFAAYTSGLAIRWYISDHAPWSNGYETMLFVGWASALSGLLFARKSPISLAVTGILSGIALFVAGMSWMNPEITPLVPVLKSYWLIIHVAIITSSYGFLAMGALLGMLNLILMIARNEKNYLRLKISIQEISYIIELALIVGLLLLTIGCFIGGVWANESWGRYWGWDPKETWALVSILVYSAILHLRNVPMANNQFVLSSLALIGFSTIIMTFFGVNYYLSGMHSYAQGTPPPIPFGVYIAIASIIVLVAWAYKSNKK